MSEQGSIFTLGHARHEWPVFWELLRAAGVLVVLDIRSQPHSRHGRHFGKTALSTALRSAGLSYFYLGAELGGRPEGEQWYREDGSLDHELRVASEVFAAGIARVGELASRAPAVLLCAEEDPVGCHRHRLVAPALEAQGWTVLHLRANGAVESEAALRKRCRPQLVLF